MKPDLKRTALRQIDALIKEGASVQSATDYPQAYSQYQGGCQMLLKLLGPTAHPLNFVPGDIDPLDDSAIRRSLGVLKALRKGIKGNLLVSVADLVRAETFGDLLEQADYLMDSSYFVAAGVLGRAVLEEHLRKWCDRAGLKSNKPHRTLNEYSTELYKANALTKVEMKHVEAMAAVGNECAHNTGKATDKDVERLLRDVRSFLSNHPLS